MKNEQMEPIVDLIWDVEDDDIESVNPLSVIMCCAGGMPPITNLCLISRCPVIRVRCWQL